MSLSGGSFGPLPPRVEPCSDHSSHQAREKGEEAMANAVKNHLAKVLQRLRAPDRTAAVVIALRNGWLELQQLHVTERSDERRVA